MPRLTKRTLDAVKPDPARETFVWCSSSPGFGARIYPSGRVIFIAQVRVGRAQRRVKIGVYGPYTVEQARERADEIVRTAAEGRDPQREKQEQKAALTVAELLDAYIEAADAGRVLTRFGRPKKPSTIAIDKGRIERHIKPLIGKLVAREVKAADIQRMADAISDGKTAVTAKSGNKRGKAVVTGGAGTAARVVELMGGVWTWAAKREHVAPLSVTKGVDKFKGSPKARALSAIELKSLGKAVRAAEAKEPMAVAALKLLALTGMRRQEAVKLSWAEYDRGGSCLHLGDSKTGRSTRPLGATAAALLDAWATSGTHPTLVFPNVRGSDPADLKKKLAAIFDAAGLEGVRSQALRSTFASIGDELGYSEAVIGSILGHTQRSVTARHYIRRPDSALVAAATRIAFHIEAAMSDQLTASITAIDLGATNLSQERGIS